VADSNNAHAGEPPDIDLPLGYDRLRQSQTDQGRGRVPACKIRGDLHLLGPIS
jgi:hypothetical protein